jgi:4-amino-4-deoxy-L-arabinose transferase-like glycosyltransferase
MPDGRLRFWRAVGLAAAVGLALRLLFGLTYWTGKPLTRDEREYLSLARSIAAGNGVVYDDTFAGSSTAPFSRAPGYPAFLALVGGGSAPSDAVPAPVKIAQAFVGIAGIVLVALFARRIGGPRAGVVGAWLAAAYPPLVWISAYAFSEAVFWPMGLAAAWYFSCAVAPDADRPAARLFAVGLLAGTAVLVRPAMLVFLLLAAVWLLWRRRAVGLTTALACGAMLVVLPWTARNYTRFHHVVLVAAEGGVTFWTGNHPLAVGDGDLAANPQLKIASQTLKDAHPGLTEEQMEPIYYRDALAWMRAHPIDWLVLEARKIVYLVVPLGPSYRLHSWRYFVASAGTYLLLLPAALAGAWRLGPARRRLPGLWLLLAAAIVTCLIFFPQERFRIPVIDPVLIVCAAAVWMTGRETPSAA